MTGETKGRRRSGMKGTGADGMTDGYRAQRLRRKRNHGWERNG